SRRRACRPRIRGGNTPMPSTASMHELDASQVHYAWDNSLAPRLVIEPGDTVVFQTRDAADGYYSRASSHPDVLNRGPFRGHPLTGPVLVKGAEPGDALVVEVLGLQPAADFRCTASRQAGPRGGCSPVPSSPSRFSRSGISRTGPTHAWTAGSPCPSRPSPA